MLGVKGRGIKTTVIRIEMMKESKKTEISKIVNRRKSFGAAVKLVIPLRSRDGCLNVQLSIIMWWEGWKISICLSKAT